ncbi:MAG: ATP-binding cassette domain-containing protein [Flavobacteriales bacterium]|nr:ATP-binding cassette domain-containing protein [Flavobacteriales bacterium]
MIIDINSAKIFQKKNLILQDVNVKIGKGEFVYLIGKTGSGKSSLLKTLYADLPLQEGEGTVCDFDLKKIKRSKVPFLRRKLGIVFQDFQLLSDRSVDDNLKFVLKATGWKDKTKMTERITEVLENVGLGAKGYKFPHELSGGEQQRVVIARALLNEPDLILADEPTGNLDPETSEEIMKLLYDISKKGKAILMATHDFHLMEKFKSRTIKCQNSTVVEVAGSAFSQGLTPSQIDSESSTRSEGDNL